MPTRIGLIHAVKAAMPPVEAAFSKHWPATTRFNLLDDSLPVDLEAAGALTTELSARLLALASYVAGTGAAAVLFTCSAFGPAIEAAARALPLPVLKPNEAMFERALAVGRRIGMLATFAPAVASMEEEFRDLARRRGSPATLETLLVSGAAAALRAGDSARHDRLVGEAAPALAHCEAVMLAHFSTSTDEEQVQARISSVVLAAPSSAVLKLRSTLDGGRTVST